jgi:hypothetical protein
MPPSPKQLMKNTMCSCEVSCNCSFLYSLSYSAAHLQLPHKSQDQELAASTIEGNEEIFGHGKHRHMENTQYKIFWKH